MRQMRRVLDVLRDVVAARSGHADVGQHDIRRCPVQKGNRLLAVAHRDDQDIFVREGQLDHALDRHAVVGEEKRVRHLDTIGYRTDFVFS